MAEVILDAAEHRLRKEGYNALSFRDLAADVKVKSSSVHYYYRHKEDLGVALVKRYHERFIEAVGDATQDVQTAKEKLKAFCRVYREALNEDSAICLCGMLGAESQGLPKVVRVEVENFFNSNIDWLADALPRRQSKKNRHKIAMHIVATLQGAMMLAISLNDTEIFDHVVHRIMQTQRLNRRCVHGLP